jgi:hypothetical protein
MNVVEIPFATSKTVREGDDKVARSSKFPILIDLAGNVYANSEDGNLYVIQQGGSPLNHIFLNQAIGAAYTPLSLGPDGRIYTENDSIRCRPIVHPTRTPFVNAAKTMARCCRKPWSRAFRRGQWCRWRLRRRGAGSGVR